jgi:transposase
VRAPLPAHPPRERVVIGAVFVPACGWKLAKLGEDVTETLEANTVHDSSTGGAIHRESKKGLVRRLSTQ